MIASTVLLVFFLALVLPAAPGNAADVKAGAKLSLKRCAKCHGKTGAGDGPGLEKIKKIRKVDVTPADWTSRAVMSKWTDEQLVKIIKGGGKAVGKSKVMPAYKKRLSDAQVADLVAYIRSLTK